ncbi:Methyltransferase type 11 [Smithella sp. ME-1]|uniref:Methyltransferase type 11 n=1 Tax=hydrocarbon metagenome TaxID=938273 RepID=A0A0W8FKY3_9ZZZZ|nr:Methyltransferase type 11 [Smithella sp. ME-1]
MFLDQKSAQLSDEQQKALRRNYIISRQKKLILDLLVPLAGERILDVGCGAGDNLHFFQEKWCSLTGIDSSKEKLEIARQKYGDHAELVLAQPDDIPFSDNEFDIVTLINILEISDNPRKIIEEAIRVCRNRVFIGFINNCSFVSTKQGLKEMFGFPLSRKIHLFSFPEIKTMVKKCTGDITIKWGSVIYFPNIVHSYFEKLEEIIPIRKNPIGAFVGMTFPVKYTYRTAQSPIMEAFKLEAKARNTAPEAIREILRQTDK